MSGRVKVAALFSVVAAVALAGGCYGPTEIAVELSTDVRCDERPDTAIFSGRPFRSEPRAVTDACSAAAGGAEIGSIVFTPSKGRDGAAAVKVVMAVGGRVEECDARPDRCIVASRSFSYLEHRSLRLPVRLLAECKGKQCPEGTTCGPGRTCVPDGVRCVGDACDLPPAATPPDDAGVRLVPSCATPSVLTTTATPAIPGSSAYGAGTFYFASDRATVKKIDVAGGTGELAYAATPGADVTIKGLAVAGTRPVILWREGPTLSRGIAKLQAEGGPVVDLGEDDDNVTRKLVVVSEAGTSVAYVGRQKSLERIPDLLGASPTRSTFFTGSALDVALDPTHVYVDDLSGSVAVYGRPVPGSPTYVDLTQAGLARFATFGDTVFAFGRNGAPFSIGILDGASYRPIAEPAAIGVLTSLTADATHVYYVAQDGIGASILRAAWGSGLTTPLTVLPAERDRIRAHLVVDAGCLFYWEGGGIPSELRVMPVPP